MTILRALIMVAAMSGPATAETVQLFAAGSLRAALTDVGAAFEKSSGHKVEAKWGPSGTLKDEIMGGANAQVFASANMEHPAALAQAGRSGKVTMFARNRLCALARPGLAVSTTTLLDVMLDPAIKVATSTPKADPSGDYAFEMFRKAEALKPGARDTLERKALQLTGGATSAQTPGGKSH